MSLATATDYELLKKLKAGGMAEVFLARKRGAQGFEKKVVLKRLLPHLSTDAGLRRMFLDEARLAARLNHPNIAQVFDLGETDGEYWFAMEHVGGDDLGELLNQLIERGQRMPFEHAVRIVCIVCEALDYAHAIRGEDGAPLGLVHRDVTPSNIILTADGVIKLIDFGIARGLHRAERTNPGLVLGKLGYMSPEQARGEAVDPRTDLFSVGVVLWELLTNERPYSAENLVEQLQMASSGFPDPRERAADVPDDVVPILRKAMASDPDERYSAARELQLELERLLQASQLISNPPLIADWMRRSLEAEPTVIAAPVRDETQTQEAHTIVGPPLAESQTPTVAGLPPAGLGELREQQLGAVAPTDPEVDQTVDAPRTSTGPAHAPLTELMSDRGRAARERRKRLGIAAVISVGAALALAISLWPTAAQPSDEPLLWPENKPAGGRGLASSTQETADDSPPDDSPPDDSPPDDSPPDDSPPDDSPPDDSPPDDSPPDDSPPDNSPPDDALLDDAPPAAGAPQGRIALGAPASSSRREPSARARRTARPAGQGRLTLDVKPWAEVFWKKRRLGLTPLADLKLPAGRHRLRLVNDELGVRKTHVVTITAGGHARVIVDLR